MQGSAIDEKEFSTYFKYHGILYIVRLCKFYDQIRENLLSTYITNGRHRRSDGRISTDSQSAQDVVAGQFEHHRRRYIWCDCEKELGKELKKKRVADSLAF